jgi:MoxR-like ATPase
VDYGGSSAKRTYHIDLIGIVKSTTTTPVVGNLTYDAAVTAVAEMAQAKLYDGTKTADRNALSADLESLFMTTPALGPFALAEDTALVGIDPLVYRQIEAAVNSGKRHIILYGPPGTGKTTLAEYLARELSERDDGDGSYLMLTASSSWSAQDLVGGYQPMGGGNIGFIPGALLRDFDKPVIIDELNRCPIDKVLGPLFSILSGQASVLPCRVDISDPQSRFHVIYPEPKAHMDQHEHAPKPAWRLICTLNTYDKTQLGQISYALSRRFSWIKIGAPANPDDFVLEISTHLGISVPDPIAANPVAAMWRAVNQAREIGGAPVIDFLKTLSNLDSKVPLFELPSRDAAPLFLAAFRTCILPLMDGLSPREASNLASGIAEAWNLDRESSALLHTDCAEFSA